MIKTIRKGSSCPKCGETKLVVPNRVELNDEETLKGTKASNIRVCINCHKILNVVE